MTALVPGSFDYDVAVLDPGGRLLHLPRASMVWEEQENELSASVTCRLPDVETTEGPMYELVMPGTPFYLSLVERGRPGAPRTRASSNLFGGAWDPEPEDERGTPGGFGGAIVGELLRGRVLKVARAGNGIELEVTVRDALIELLQHDVDEHIDEGTSAADALTEQFNRRGVSLGTLDWPDVSLPEITARGEKFAKLVDDILAQGPKQGQGFHTLRMSGETLDVIVPGGNADVFWLRDEGRGAGISNYSIDISELVATVEICSHGDDEDAGAIEALDGSSGFNGARRLIFPDEKLTDDMLRLQAQSALADKGFPKQAFEHSTFDIPLVRKWDRIRISDSLLDGYFIVTGVSHNCSAGTMALKLETPEDFERKGRLLQLQAQLDQLKSEQQKAEEAARASAGGGSASLGTSAVGGGGGAALLQQVAGPMVGKCYEWGGPVGRSIWAANPGAASTDCSGFAAWMYHQLGHPGIPAYTGSMYNAGLQQVGSGSLAGAAPGDLILSPDHVQVYIGNNQVLESGGTVRCPSDPSRSGIGVGTPTRSGFVVLRSPTVFQRVNGGGMR